MSYRSAIARLEEQADESLQQATEATDALHQMGYLVQAVVLQLRAVRLSVSEAFAPEFVPEVDVPGPFHRVQPQRECGREGCAHPASLHATVDGGPGPCHASDFDGEKLVECLCQGFVGQ